MMGLGIGSGHLVLFYFCSFSGSSTGWECIDGFRAQGQWPAVKAANT